MKGSLRPALAAVVVTGAAVACSSSTSGAGVGMGASGAVLSGTYTGTGTGPIAAITFYLVDHYVLETTACDDAGGGGCGEFGTYSVDSSGTSLTLYPSTGPARSLPFSSDVVEELPLTTSSEGADTLHLQGSSLTGGDGGTSLTSPTDGGMADGGVSLIACTQVPIGAGEGGVPTAPVSTQVHVGGQPLKGGSSPTSPPSPTDGWKGCTGSYDTSVSLTGAYYITDFGCAAGFTGDPADNCCAAGAVGAYAAGLCPGIKTKPASNCSNACAGSNSCNSWRAGSWGTPPTAAEAANFGCEEEVKYYTTGVGVWGAAGSRLCLTTADKKKSVVVAAYDAGPACSIERRAGAFLLDVSPAVSTALYGGSQYSASDKKLVFVSAAPAGLALGASCPVVCPGLDAGASEAGP